MILLALFLAADVQMLAVPIPMETVRERLDIKRSPVGLWNFAISNDTDQPVNVSREKLGILMAEWCAAHKAPMPLLLTKEQAWPILTNKSGGKWKAIARYAKLLASIAAVVMTARNPDEGTTEEAVKDIASIGVLLLGIFGGAATARVPDISTLPAELPSVIVIPAHSGVTLSAWSAKMSSRPQVIGPVVVSD